VESGETRPSWGRHRFQSAAVNQAIYTNNPRRGHIVGEIAILQQLSARAKMIGWMSKSHMR
jgi:hypothetical protein